MSDRLRFKRVLAPEGGFLKGIYLTQDGRFYIRRRVKGNWCLNLPSLSPSATPDAQFLASFGLHSLQKTSFSTRREALQVLKEVAYS
jgi:hypothetical protein